ncbi:MAG: response regulator transcription factor [Rhodospirillaceae bacterium]|nr:response regulator transcription factor [Rhodospirillaceae bacterium]
MGNNKRVLVIDDDAFMRSMLVEQLPELEGYTCVGAATGNEGIKLGAEEYFDLVLLDVGLPDISGFEACRALRAQGLLAPIVMLTAADDEIDTITGLDAGATDYITKPFKLGVLLARLRAHIRQFEMSDEAMLHIGPFGFQPGQRTLIETGSEPGNERTVRLTDKEAQILKFLYLQGGEPVSRKDLLGEVWGYNAQVTTHTLETHVYRLRQKIERDPTNAEILLTDQGGYRLAI